MAEKQSGHLSIPSTTSSSTRTPSPSLPNFPISLHLPSSSPCSKSGEFHPPVIFNFAIEPEPEIEGPGRAPKRTAWWQVSRALLLWFCTRDRANRGGEVVVSRDGHRQIAVEGCEV
ncbi:unnamed protein product [Linum trigynum]|uniref:Uncharacterized protein n=1 Tax=Linum trigynum TaxID=586398 RepID=A0AAV2EXN2_9ROSI